MQMNGVVLFLFFHCSRYLFSLCNPGPILLDPPTVIATIMARLPHLPSPPRSLHPQKGWSNQKLRPGKRRTRGSAGWSEEAGWVFSSFSRFFEGVLRAGSVGMMTRTRY